MKTYVLGIENFMKIEKATIPLKGVIGLVGKNAQGKTSVIRAIQDILTGNNDCTKIRDGAERAVISITATDENTGEELFTIARTQTADRAVLKDKGLKNGQTPAGVLGCLFDEVAINPVRLLENGPVEYLKKHLKAGWDVRSMPEDLGKALAAMMQRSEGMRGIALSTEEGFRTLELFAGAIEMERKFHAREVKNLEAVVENQRKALPEEMPAAPYDAQALHLEETELRAAKENAKVINTQYSERCNVVNTAERQVAGAQKEVDKHKQSIADLEEQLAQEKAWLQNAEEGLALRKAELEAAIMSRSEITPVSISDTDSALVELGKKLTAMKNHQAIVNAFAALRDQNTKLKRMREEHETMDRLFKYFRYEAPKQLIEKCKLGVDGVEFRDGEMYVKDRHISKMSAAERAIVATKLAITVARQKGHVAVCLDGIENLDQEHMADFIAAAEAEDIAVIYTRVGEAPAFPCERLVEGGVIQ